MPIRLVNIGLRFQSAGARILHIFVSITGLTPQAAVIVLLVIVGYIILLIILIPIHKSLVRLLRKRKEKLTREYDTLRYLVAKAQKQNTTSTESRGIKILFDVTHPDYLRHHQEIKNEIANIESSLGSKIVQDAQRNEIETKQKKYNNLKTIVNIYGRIVSAITILVYKLFW